MATLSELQARRETLRKAMHSGVLQIRNGDSWTTFRSMKEMREALADIDAQIADLDTTTRVRTIRFYTGSGW